MLLRDLDYELPSELIAQRPLDRRDGSRALPLACSSRSRARASASSMDEKANVGGGCFYVNWITSYRPN